MKLINKTKIPIDILENLVALVCGFSWGYITAHQVAREAIIKEYCTTIIESKATVGYVDEEIADAIYLAEGGDRANYLYGIRSVTYSDEADARRICLNTIRNNRIRFTKQTKYNDYLEFLASRYCPINSDNDTGTNKYWLKNVTYFLKHGTK